MTEKRTDWPVAFDHETGEKLAIEGRPFYIDPFTGYPPPSLGPYAYRQLPDEMKAWYTWHREWNRYLINNGIREAFEPWKPGEAAA